MGVIVYGNSKNEANICNNGFGYRVSKKSTDEDKYLNLELEPFVPDAHVKNLKVEVNLLNDEGAIRVQIYQVDD